jgi:hypothetical protein
MNSFEAPAPAAPATQTATSGALALTALVAGVADGRLAADHPAVAAKFIELAARLGATGTLADAVAIHRKLRG